MSFVPVYFGQMYRAIGKPYVHHTLFWTINTKRLSGTAFDVLRVVVPLNFCKLVSR